MTATRSALLQPDPVVAQRDVLLDDDHAGRRFSHKLGLDEPLAVDSCRYVDRATHGARINTGA